MGPGRGGTGFQAEYFVATITKFLPASLLHGKERTLARSHQRRFQLGYQHQELYYRLSRVHYDSYNFGLALQAIDTAIKKATQQDSNYVKYMCRQAEILVEMEQFNEAHKILTKAYRLSPSTVKKWLWLDRYKMAESIMCRYGLAYKFSDSEEISLLMLGVTMVIALWKGKELPEIILRRKTDDYYAELADMDKFSEDYLID